jgi:hypothetical protein
MARFQALNETLNERVIKGILSVETLTVSGGASVGDACTIKR